MKTSSGSVLLGTSVAAVTTAVVYGLFVLGSPMEERSRRIDIRRVTDLRAIAAATDLYWTRHSRLPASLDELNAEPGVRIDTMDPASSEPYGFRALDSLNYELCASFDGESEPTQRDAAWSLWAHGPGLQCFHLGAEEVTRDAEGRKPAAGFEADQPASTARRPHGGGGEDA